LSNFGSSLARLLEANQRFLDALGGAPVPEVTTLALQVDQQSITVLAFGHQATGRFRPVSSARGVVGEYVFRTVGELGEPLEVSRFYLESFHAGEIGGVFRDPELQDRVCDGSNPMIASYICCDVATAIRAKMFSPSPRR
jgi:hypothetical protein